MERLRPSGHLLPFLRALLAILVLGLVFGPAVAQAQRKSAKPTPKPSATPQPLTADKIGGAADADQLPDPVAKVNGQVISRADLQKVTEALLASKQQKLSDLSADDRKSAYLSVLAQIIDDRLITAQAKDEKVDDLKVEQTYANLQKDFGDTAAFEAQIKKSGQTPEKIRANIRGQIAQQQWLEKQIGPDTQVTPQEVEKFYKDGPSSQFEIPEMVQASHILVAVRRDAPPEDVLAAEERVKAIEERLKKGDPFDVVAREGSDDPNSKNAGGDLGPFTRERVLPEIGDAAFKLKVGEVSPPVRSPFGFHIIKVTDRKPAHLATLDEVRKQIEAYLVQQKRSAAAAKVVQTLRANAKIENYLS